MKRFLLVSLLFLLFACSSDYRLLVPSAGNTSCLLKFKPSFRNELYSAQVDVVGRHISGLVLFKHLSDSSLHVVFMNEAGVTFFDFEFQSRDRFTVHHIIPYLDKKAVVRTLQRDFELVTMRRVGQATPVSLRKGDEVFYAFPAGKETDYVVTDTECMALRRIESGSRKKMTEVKFFGPSSAVPDSISVRHFNFNMTISLKKLIRG